MNKVYDYVLGLKELGSQEGYVLRKIFSETPQGSGWDIAKVMYDLEAQGLVFRTKKNEKQVTWHLVK
jgi:hypothetical protein